MESTSDIKYRNLGKRGEMQYRIKIEMAYFKLRELPQEMISVDYSEFSEKV